MYRSLIFLLFASLAYSQQAAPSDSHCSLAADDRAVEQISQDWKDGYNNGDAPKVAALYTDDAYYLTQHFATGVVHGRAAIQAYVKLGTDAHYRLDKIEIVQKHCSGDFAYAITRYESTNAGVKAFGVNLVLMKKIDGKWKIVAHESAVPDPATAVQKLPVAAESQK